MCLSGDSLFDWQRAAEKHKQRHCTVSLQGRGAEQDSHWWLPGGKVNKNVNKTKLFILMFTVFTPALFIFSLWDTELENCTCLHEFKETFCMCCIMVQLQNHPFMPFTFRSCFLSVYFPPCVCVCVWTRGYPVCVWAHVCRAEMTSTLRFCTPSWSYTSSQTWTWFKLSASSCGASGCPARLRRSTAWWRRSLSDTVTATLECFRAQVCVQRGEKHQFYIYIKKRITKRGTR